MGVRTVTVSAALILALLTPLTAWAVPPQLVIGPATFTDVIGDPDRDPETVACPAGSVLTSVPVDITPTGYVGGGAGANCAPVAVSAGNASLGSASYAGGIGTVPSGGDATAGCPAGSVVVGFAGSAQNGQFVDSLRVYCRILNADGTLGPQHTSELVGTGAGGATGPHLCPSGAVATGISGAANPDATEEDLYSFRLRCQVVDYSDPLTHTPGPPVFGPEQQTDAVGADGPPATEVDCPDGTVLTGLRIGLKGTRYVASAGALCSPVTVNAGEVSLGGTAALAGTLGNPDPVGGVTDLNCPSGSLITGFRGAENHRGFVDALRPICRLLFDDGGIGTVDQEGSWGGKPGQYTKGPFRCASGAVATGIAGTAEADYYEENLVSFRLICRSLNFPTVTPSEFNLTWATALTVGANSTTTSAITATGQDRWFRFPVQPGSRVRVELSDLPADYDLTLFKDIEQAFTTLTSTEDLVKLSAEFAGDAYAPSVFSPSVFSPSVFSPSVFSPSVFSPSVFSPSVFSPSVFSPSVFSPSVFSPSVFSPSVSLPSVFSPSVFSPSVFSPSVFSDAFASAQTRSVIGFSSRDGRATESISSATYNNTGYFYVRVQGRNGSFATDDFTLTVATTSGICAAPLEGFASTPTLVGTPGSAETVILTDPARLPGTPAEKATLAAALTTFAGQVNGAVVDLGASERVQALQNQANDPALVACPYAKNLVAEAARDIVNSYRDDAGTLKYVVVAGDDSVVPFFRYADNAGLGPESNYAPPMADDTPSEASLRGNYVLGQDAYGAEDDVSVKGTVVPVPDLAVGRLVESPVDITAAVQRFGTRAGAPLTPTSTLATGYDFLTDAADAVAVDFAAGIPGGDHDTLITDADVPPSTTTQGGTPSRRTSWTATDLRNSLLGSRHDMVFLAGHFSANNTLAADYDTTVNSTELASAPAGTFTDALVFSIGCHSGYTIVDGEGIPNVTVGLDWTEAFAKQGATLIAGTGYQYGDTDFIEYSEKLYADFAEQLRIGTGAVPVGRALVQAKQNYLESAPTLQGIDQKSVIQATLYGLPMLGVNLPEAGRLPAPDENSIAAPSPVTTGPGSVLDLQTDDIELTPALDPVTRDLVNLDGGSVTATYLVGPDGVSANPAEPTLPLVDSNVSVPGQVLRGIALRSATYSDTDGITPLTGAPATETHSVHTPFVTPAFFPGKIATANYFDAVNGGDTRLLVTPAQHRSDAPGSLTTTQRRYSELGLRLLYSSNITEYGDNVPALAAPPTITDVRTAITGGSVAFSARVAGNPAAGIQSVFVTYTGERDSEFHGEWASLDLVQDAEDSTLWTGSLDLPAGQDADDVRYLVQAVNGVGLVGIDDNQGAYFTPGVIPGENLDDLAPSELLLSGANPTAGDYGDTVTVRATLTNESTGDPLAQRLVTFGVGGATRTVFTNDAGVATAPLPLSVLPGSYPLTADYDGDATTAPASAAPGDFTVRKQPTTLTLAVTGSGVTATLTGLDDLPLREQTVYFGYVDAAGTVLAGRTVSTGWLGTAELPLTDRPAGATRVTAYFGTAETPLPGGETADLSSASYRAAGPVSVTLPSTAPVARPDSYTTPEGRTLTVAAPGVLGNDTGADTASLVSGPATGQLTLRADGSFKYVPPGDFVGTVTFRYAANRAGQASVPATVTITVTESTPSGCTIRGTSGDDTLTGTGRKDVICGFGGNDTIAGGDGNDLIYGGSGTDTMSGGKGNDLLDGRSGADQMTGGPGIDILRTGSGNDVADGEAGNDLLEGADGDDRLSGGPDEDALIGGRGLDRLAGGDAADYLDVRDGAPGDVADGGPGKDAAVRDPGDTVTGVP